MKITNPFTLQRQVSFNYASSRTDGIYLLSKFVTKLTFQPKFNEGLVGKIDTDKIEIWLFRPLNKNALLPAFYGKFDNKDGTTVLTGEFRLHKKTKLTYQIGFIVTIAFWVCIGIRDHSVIAPLWGLIGTIVLIGVSLLLCNRIFIKDMETIEQQIRNILTNGSI